jgi:hypothetical protein
LIAEFNLYGQVRCWNEFVGHVLTWQRKFAKITRLRKLSAAGRDEINFIITLDDEHYNGYV